MTNTVFPAGVDAPVSTPMAENGFGRLGLAPELLQAVTDLGFTEPTTVQARAIPLAMGHGADHAGFIDLMVSSQTGSGKTAAFLLPVLHTLLAQHVQAGPASKRPSSAPARRPKPVASPCPSARSARTP